MTKRVLLTGGGGAIGFCILWHFLEATDWEIVALDSFRHKGDPARITKVKEMLPQEAHRITVLKHDLCCPISPELTAEIGPIDYILHLAALSDVFFSVENSVYTITNNVLSTLTMLEYAKHNDHEAFVYFSTDEVYGPVESGKAHAEWDTHRPSNPYSASKAASEDICYAYWRAGWAKVIITNTMNNYSPLQAPSKYPAMIKEKLEKGEKITVHASGGEYGSRFYIHSKDVADGLLFILENFPVQLHNIGEIDDPARYHLVGSVCLNNLELPKEIARIMGKDLEYEVIDYHQHNPAHDLHYGLEDNKLRPAGWKEKLGFEEGMKQTLEFEE